MTVDACTSIHDVFIAFEDFYKEQLLTESEVGVLYVERVGGGCAVCGEGRRWVCCMWRGSEVGVLYVERVGGGCAVCGEGRRWVCCMWRGSEVGVLYVDIDSLLLLHTE